MASITGARRKIDDSATLARTRATRSKGVAADALRAGPTAKSCSTISSAHGWKSTAPSVTSRPSAADSRAGACHRTSGGTASHVTTHNAATATTALASRLVHFPCTIACIPHATAGHWRAVWCDFGRACIRLSTGVEDVAPAWRPRDGRVNEFDLSGLTQSG